MRWLLSVVLAVACAVGVVTGSFSAFGDYPRAANRVRIGVQLHASNSEGSSQGSTFATNFLSTPSLTTQWSPVQLFTNSELDGTLVWRCAVRSHAPQFRIDSLYVCQTRVTHLGVVGAWLEMEALPNGLSHQIVPLVRTHALDGVFSIQIQAESLEF